jgi:hypothetical protein
MTAVLFSCAAAICVWGQSQAQGQLVLSNLGTITEDFDTLGSSTNLPTYWRSRIGEPNTWKRAASTVAFSTDSGEPQAQGSYNWGDASLTNRALGFLATSPTNAVSFILRIRNSTLTSVIRSFAVNYSVKQFYRGGSGGLIQLDYSTNGSSWSAISSTSLVSSNFLNPSGYLFEKPNTIAVSISEFSTPEVLPEADIYFRWTLSVVSAPGAGFGIDDVRITSSSLSPASHFTYQDTGEGAAITGYTGTAASVSIPPLIDGKNVTRITENAFVRNSSITHVELPDTVTLIDDAAFYLKPLTNVILGSGVTSIGKYAFQQTLLTNISIPGSVTNIGDYAFAYTPLTTANISSGSIGNYAFWATPLNNVVLGNGVTRIGGAAFEGTHLTSINIPASVTYIGEGAFWGSQLTSITIPASVTEIGSAAFGYIPNLTSVLWRGNAPQNVDWTAYLNPNAIIFYMPDALGWTPLHGAIATQVFQPTALLPSFADSTGFQFSWTGTGAIPMNVERSTSLIGPWIVVSPSNTTGEFVDPSPPAGRAFYRSAVP